MLNAERRTRSERLPMDMEFNMEKVELMNTDCLTIRFNAIMVVSTNTQAIFGYSSVR